MSPKIALCALLLVACFAISGKDNVIRRGSLKMTTRMNQTAAISAATSEHGWWQKLFGLGKDATKNKEEVKEGVQEEAKAMSLKAEEVLATDAPSAAPTDADASPSTDAAGNTSTNLSGNETGNSFNETVGMVDVPERPYDDVAITEMAKESLEDSAFVAEIAGGEEWGGANGTIGNGTAADPACAACNGNVTNGVEDTEEVQQVLQESDNNTESSSSPNASVFF